MLAETLGMQPLQAHCHRGLGSLYAKIGRPERARGELSIAIELYRAMEMTFWQPQAEAALAEAEGIDQMWSPILASGGSSPVTGLTTTVSATSQAASSVTRGGAVDTSSPLPAELPLDAAS